VYSQFSILYRTDVNAKGELYRWILFWKGSDLTNSPHSKTCIASGQDCSFGLIISAYLKQTLNFRFHLPYCIIHSLIQCLTWQEEDTRSIWLKLRGFMLVKFIIYACRLSSIFSDTWTATWWFLGIMGSLAIARHMYSCWALGNLCCPTRTTQHISLNIVVPGQMLSKF